MQTFRFAAPFRTKLYESFNERERVRFCGARFAFASAGASLQKVQSP